RARRLATMLPSAPRVRVESSGLEAMARSSASWAASCPQLRSASGKAQAGKLPGKLLQLFANYHFDQN
ncbi:hypothetical protein, partial [Methanothrix soehngenii]|uniref:hypothetical protein n=1 Tax=Methanothrix soehngenii TaxID=2223 RepID=UPI002FE061AF